MAKHHPKMEDFDGPFGTYPPRAIQFSDIDSVVEVNGFFLFVEYKSHRDISKAQRLLYERLSMLEDGESVVVMQVVGDGANRNAEGYRECINGVWSEWTDCDWGSLRNKIQSFMVEARARKNAKQLAEWRAKNPIPYPSHEAR